MIMYKNLKDSDVKFTFFTDSEIWQVNTNNEIVMTNKVADPIPNCEFLGLKHKVLNKFIPVNEINPSKIKDMDFVFKNGDPIYHIVEKNSCGNRTIWNNYCYGISFDFKKAIKPLKNKTFLHKIISTDGSCNLRYFFVLRYYRLSSG